jgi:ADP-heptose:LPS heptosyltransferase/GT2 family glycosyltransferase
VIELDPGVGGGFLRNRFDIMISGRVLSDAPLAATRVQIGDAVASAAFYGEPERATPAVLPDGRPGRQRNFWFALPRETEGAPDRCAFQVVSRTSGGIEYAETFVAAFDPIAQPPVWIVSGPVRSAPDGTRPVALMYVEKGAIDAGGALSVQGWAVSLSPIQSIRIFAGDEYVAEASFKEDRDDVSSAFSGYPNAGKAGFSCNAQLDEIDQDARTIRIQVVCANRCGLEETIPVERITKRLAGRPAAVVAEPKKPVKTRTDAASGFSLLNRPPAYQLNAALRIDHEAPLDNTFEPATLPLQGALAPLAPPMRLFAGVAPGATPSFRIEPNATIEMYCDEARLTGDGMLSVNGWAICGTGIAQVRVLLGDRDVGLATYGHERLDVGRIFNTIPMSHLSGFKFDQKVGEQCSGEFKVRVVVVNTLKEQQERELNVVATPSSASADAEAGGAPATPDYTVEFRFQLDSPGLTNDVASEAVTGRLTIDGWLLTRSGIAKFEVFLDGQRLGEAHHGLARQDVGAAFPEWPNSLRAGFAFHCPPRALKDGEHKFALRIVANSGQEMTREFRITVKKSDDQQDLTGIRRRVPRVEADMMLAFLAGMNYRPAFRFLLRQDGAVDPARLQVTLDALRTQAFGDWTVLVLAPDDDAAAAVQAIVGDQMPHLANRFTTLTPSDGDAWTGPLAREDEGRGVLHALLSPGDEPGADALLELAVAGGLNPHADMIYGDEVRLSPVSHEKEPFFKPDFSPDLLLSCNYVGRAWVAAAALLGRTGASAAGLMADGEYDLVLRCAELANGIQHVPKLLCQRAALQLDTPEQERSALHRMLPRRGIAAEIVETTIPGTWRVRREVQTTGKISIIIPTCAANGYIETILSTLRDKTAYRNFEIIVIDNIPAGNKWKAWLPEHADKIVNIPGTFNWSIFNNRATEVADGDYFLFLNDDMEVTHTDWLDALLEHAQRPEVGLTGPQLLYRDGSVQHAGMFLSSNGIGRHAFRFAARDDPCYFGLNLTQRNVMAVTGACMLVRRDTFERLGGFDEAHQITNNDLDFCLRAHRAGLLTVFTPYASLIHYELASRAGMRDVFNMTHFDAVWKTTFAAGDPYFNPRLSRHADDYRPDDEPVQWVACGTPLFHKEEIERILVVKLDHIGDFVTALAPIRRLKKIFPNAHLTVLAGPASKAFISLEPSIDEFIPFAFFHARSQLGERELDKTEYDALAQQLRPRRFDLAVDLRKHPSTRDVLKYTGARFLAGFDHSGQFPNLDIALNWDGDQTLQRKRNHVVDDLIGLVDAIGHATDNDRAVMQPEPPPMPLSELPDAVQPLFARPVVAVHPGAGNITKQWPEEHFSALIDLLIEKNNVNILLVGGPDEVEIADRLLHTGQHPERMATLAGQTKLADLPRLLKNCVLYIGNDSGPKHIASAVGIATIGIHSGVVDPVEWGPIGVNAVALRRNMNCSPCYMANADDCPRSLACLRSLEPNLVYETAKLMLRSAASDG